jgi:FeS assembly protein IscX
MDDVLTWDESYAIARALSQLYPHADLTNVSLNMIYQWTIALPQFGDDPAMVNDDILYAIFQEWYEEVNPI